MRSDPPTTPEPGGPERSLEVELKLDVSDDTPTPDWRELPEIASLGEPEVRELDARYFDTAGFALAAAGYALRRRTGGPDEGWHLKGPRQGAGPGAGRVELGWPLGSDEAMPAGLEAEVRRVTDAPIRPIARIRNRRVATDLLDASGEVVAEFLDDHVETLDEATATTRRWREWEVELGPAAPADAAGFLAAVEAVARNAGARPASSESKIGRALGR
jgi:inorganic triphosphatase YgiF